MAEKEIIDYIKTQRSLGVHEDSIRSSLLSAGYEESEFSSLLEKHRKTEKSLTRREITIKHLLYFNFLSIIVFFLVIGYLVYEFNIKINDMSESNSQNFIALNETINSHKSVLSSKIESVDSALNNRLDSTSRQISSVDSSIRQTIQETTYQSLTRDSALSDSIQKISNKSLTELSSFEKELSIFKKSTVDFSSIIPKAVNSVVTIGRKSVGIFTVAGSGAFINKEGYIVTNYHVIDDLASPLVKTNDGRELAATVVGKNTEWDVALIKVNIQNGIDYLDWGNSNNISVGDQVIAVGNPVGFESTVTQGIISNTNRVLPGESGRRYFQTDVAINAGNSGGPLIDKNGKIIGIATMKYAGAGYEGLSFALKSNDVQGIVMNLMQN